MSTIDKARPSAENLQQRLDFETLISELSSRFINLHAGEVDSQCRGDGGCFGLPTSERGLCTDTAVDNHA